MQNHIHCQVHTQGTEETIGHCPSQNKANQNTFHVAHH